MPWGSRTVLQPDHLLPSRVGQRVAIGTATEAVQPPGLEDHLLSHQLAALEVRLELRPLLAERLEPHLKGAQPEVISAIGCSGSILYHNSR